VTGGALKITNLIEKCERNFSKKCDKLEEKRKR
jgi:hypothetical protein